ncbi:uncharacterized protein LOC143023022 [Oratosquilla oratoria]|uniref:uncharacterized protein LOC143023022 n=1 Tax=Oratosquilla oratoria TaxID=337810 RepID=UPI003F75C518
MSFISLFLIIFLYLGSLSISIPLSYGEDITEELFDIRRSHWDSGSPSGKSQITRYLREIQEGEGMVEMIKEVKMKGKCKKECERKEKQEKNDVEDHSHQCFTDSNERNNFHSDPHLTKTPKTSRLLEPICPRTLIIDPLSFLRKCEEHKMNHKLQSTESGGAVPHTPQQEIKDLKKNNSKTVVINPLEYLKRCEKNPVGDKENNTFSTVFDKDFLSNSQTSKDVNESCQSKLSDVDNVLQNHNTNNVNSFIKAKCEPEVKMNIDSTQEVWLPSLVTQPLYYVDVPNLHHKAEKRKWQDMRTFYPQNPEITNFPQNVIYNAPSPSNPSSHNSFYEANAQHPSRSSTGRSFLLVPNHPASCRRVCPSESLQPVTLIPRYQTGHLSTVGPQTEISEATNFQFYISRDNELSSQSSGHQSGGSQPNSHDMILHMSPAQQLGQGQQEICKLAVPPLWSSTQPAGVPPYVPNSQQTAHSFTNMVECTAPRTLWVSSHQDLIDTLDQEQTQPSVPFDATRKPLCFVELPLSRMSQADVCLQLSDAVNRKLF